MSTDETELVNPYGKHPKAAAAQGDNGWTVIEPGESPMATLKSQNGCMQPVSVIFAAILISASILWSFAGFDGRNRQDDQQQTQPDDQSPPIDDVVNKDDIQGARLVLVYEKTSPTPDQVLAVREYNTDRTVALGMLGVATYDEEEPAARPFVDWANGRGVPTPGMFLLKERSIIRGSAFTSTTDIKEFLGG